MGPNNYDTKNGKYKQLKESDGNKDRHGIHIAKLKIMNKDRLGALNKILKTKDREKSGI